MKYHCLFEQSGTFRDVFRSKGLESYDYDISNQFDKTDFVIDLFEQIDYAFNCKMPTIFDTFEAGDYVLAFFPCVRFSCLFYLTLRGAQFGQKDWNDEQKILYSMKCENERSRFYSLISMLCVVCLRRGLKLVFENPYTQPHYLSQTFPLKPQVIHLNRKIFGDYFEKPTQYFFVGCKPNDVVEFGCFDYHHETIHIKEMNKGIKRSLISPSYAKYFIESYIL